jgi:glucose/arabinose dehydrogenase
MRPLKIILPLFFLMISGSHSSSQSILAVSSISPFATGLARVVCLSNCGDSRLFITDQSGYIRIVDSSGTVNPRPFLDIHERVVFNGEQGLLGMAFHPQYPTNGLFYVNYIGRGDSTHISRFRMMDGYPQKADSLSEFKLLTIYQPFKNHNGGDLQFGPDGYLYIGLGDGGSSGDPGNRAQNPKELLGKLLRIDVNQGNPYTIPPTNPFYTNPDTLGEIWALGLRNPWRFSFDRLTGDLWIADVGQSSNEEINIQLATSTGGENYGWKCYEGNDVYNNSVCNTEATLTFPIFTYPHGQECSVTGGYVYRGNPSSLFYGYYFFADYCSDRIWALNHTDQGWVRQEFGRFAGNNFSSFGEDSKGRLYIAGYSSGTVYRLDDVTTGIAGNENREGVKIFQSNFPGKIHIEIGNQPKQETHYTLYNLNGIVCFTGSSNDADFEINTGRLASGIYFLKINNGRNSFAKKVIVQN